MVYEQLLSITVLNRVALSQSLEAALGATFAGLVTEPGKVRAIFTAEPTPEQRAAANAIVAAHDPDVLTADQQAAAERARQLADLSAQVQAVDLSQPLDAADADRVTRYLTLRLLSQ